MTPTGLAHHARSLPRPGMSVSAEENATVITLHGDADVAALPALVDLIAGVVADDQGAVVVDLADCDFIDSACVRAVGVIATWLAGTGRGLTVRSPPRLAIMLLATFGLADLVESARESRQ